jgi:hypothetical protein
LDKRQALLKNTMLAPSLTIGALFFVQLAAPVELAQEKPEQGSQERARANFGRPVAP